MSWDQQKHSAYIQSLNEGLTNAGDVGKRIFVVDSSEFAATNSHASFARQINAVTRSEGRAAFFDAPENHDIAYAGYLLAKEGNIGIARYKNLDPADPENRHDPLDPNYVAAAFSAPYNETVNQGMHFFSRATEHGADFSTALSQGFTARFTIDHELGHTLQGLPSISDDHVYNINFHERNADAFASLKAVQDALVNGNLETTLQELATMAEARDLRLGYAPDKSSAIQGLSHDTGSTIRAIIDRAQSGQLPDDFASIDLVEISVMAQDIASETLPDYDHFQKMEVAHDIIRQELGAAPVHPELQESRLAALPDAKGLDIILAEMSGRFDAAHINTAGLGVAHDIAPNVETAKDLLTKAGVDVPITVIDVRADFAAVRGAPVMAEPHLDVNLGDFLGADASYVGDVEMLAAAADAGIAYHADLAPADKVLSPDASPESHPQAIMPDQITPP
ncbi:MAG: hypothetical protein CMH27_02940 [Micavibrio sp.]|nr:hypothetical protein [Micavibrio sp.]|tara:strand:+ start:499 stop:1851 length:1353 start_codon:yes stop_codon:yes gene_type:complete